MRVACVSSVAAIALANASAEPTCTQQLQSAKLAIKELEGTVSMLGSDSTFASYNQLENIFKKSYSLYSGIISTAFSELKHIPAVAPHIDTVESYVAEGVSAYNTHAAPVVNNVYQTALREISNVYSTVVDIPAVADVKSLVISKLGLGIETAEVLVNTAFTKLAVGAPDIAHLLPSSFLDRLLFIFALVVSFKYTVELPWKIARKVLCIMTLGCCSKGRCASKSVPKKKLPVPAPQNTVDTASVVSGSKSETVRKRK